MNATHGSASAVEVARSLVESLGGRYPSELGIDIDAGDAQVERWFVAATLFGTRISVTVAERTLRALDAAGITTIEQARHREWDELVSLLDEGATPATTSALRPACKVSPRQCPSSSTAACRSSERCSGPTRSFTMHSTLFPVGGRSPSGCSCASCAECGRGGSAARRARPEGCRRPDRPRRCSSARTPTDLCVRDAEARLPRRRSPFRPSRPRNLHRPVLTSPRSPRPPSLPSTPRRLPSRACGRDLR